MTHVLIRRSERQAYWLHNPAQHRTERVLGRGFFGFAIFAICLSMSWGAIRLIAFGTLLRPGVSGLDQETKLDRPLAALSISSEPGCSALLAHVQGASQAQKMICELTHANEKSEVPPFRHVARSRPVTLHSSRPADRP